MRRHECTFALLALLALATLSACGTPMYATRLSEPVSTTLAPVTIHVDEVHLDTRLRQTDFDEDSRIMVRLTLQASQPATFALREVRLSLQDAWGERVERTPISTGVGEPPDMLPDGELAAPISLRPGVPVIAWVAFGELPPRSTREIPERVALHFRGGVGAEVELALSEPGHPPVWRAEPTRTSNGMGFHAQLWPDGAAVNLMVSEQRYYVDPILLTGSFGIGIRDTCERSPGDSHCENLAARLQIGWPLWRGSLATLSPYAGAELAVGSSADGRSGTLVGPSLGVDVALGPLQPQHGPFPVDYERSPLGHTHLNVGFAWWFGDDIAAEGVPGVTFTVTRAMGF